MRRFTRWFVVAACLNWYLAKAAEPRHPAGIVLSVAAHAEVKRARTATWLDTQAGMILFPGDSLKVSEGNLRFALCPELSVETLPANRSLTVPESSTTVACDLPAIVSPDAIPVRGGEGPAVTADRSGAKADLIESLRSAAQARAAGDYKTAIAEYSKIARDYPAAVWTRGLVARAFELGSRSETNDAPGETYALLIGISNYSAETVQGSLAYADADALAFEQFLQQPKGGSVPKDHIRLLTNEEATRAAIDAAIDTFVRDARRPENTLIVFIAGHGDYLTTRKDPETGIEIREDPFFVTYDTYSQDVKTTGFPMSKIRDFIADQAQAFRRVIAYVDICHAGYAAHVGDSGARDLPAAVKRVFVAKQGSLGVLMATRAEPDAFAYESPTFGGGHGAFTYAVLSDLIRATPSLGHKELSLATLYGGMTGNVVYLTNGAQVPDQFSTNPQMSVLDDATLRSDFTLGPATPLPEATTRRRRGKTVAPMVMTSASIPSPLSRDDEEFRRLLRDDPLRAAQILARQEEANPPIDETTKLDRTGQLRVALEDRGQQILVRYMRGEQTAMFKSDFELCASYFVAALAIVPLSAFDESRMLFCQGRAAIFDKTSQGYQQAIQLLQQSIQLDPERAYAYNALGLVYLERVSADITYYDRAVSAFRDAIRFAPRWAYPLHNLALAYSERGDFPAAEQAYLRAMALAKYYSYLPYNLGLLNQNVNRLDTAEKFYRKAIDVTNDARRLKIEPVTPVWRERAVAWNALATLEIARRRYSRAFGYVQRARKDDDSLSAAKHNLALLLSRTGRSPEAEQLWREIIGVDSQAVVSRLALALYLDRNGEPERAVAECEELLRVSGDDLECHRLIGAILKRLDKPSEALPHLDFVRSRLRGDGAASEAWADAAGSLKISNAAEGYRQALMLYTEARDKRRVKKKLASMH